MGDKRNYILGTQYGTKGTEFNKFEQFALGLTSGGFKIAEAILELGASFIDYATDSNLVTYLEENFPKVNVDDGVGKFTELLVQYGIPYIGATKIAGRLIGLKKLDSIRQGTGVAGVARKMGYYGGLGLVTEPLVTTSRDQTLGQAFGLTTKPELSELTGRAKAVAALKQKGMMGLEAAAVGAALPVAGAVAKEGIVKATQVAKPAAQALDFAVVNPLATILAKGPVGEFVTKPTFNLLRNSVSRATEITKNSIGAKSLDEIRLIRNPENFIQRMQKSIVNNLTTSGQVPKNAFDVKQLESNVFRARSAELHDMARDLDTAIDGLVRGKENAFKRADTIPAKERLYKSVGDVLENKDKELAKELLDKLPKDIRQPVGQIKKAHDTLKSEVKNLMLSPQVLNKKGLSILNNKKITDKTEFLINKDLKEYLQKGLHASYAAFRTDKTFKLRDKKRTADALNYIEDFIKNNSEKGLTPAFIKNNARKQLDTFINQAERSKTAEYFFDEALPNFALRSRKRPGGSITFLTPEQAKFRQLPDSIEKLLGKGGVQESIFDTNIILAQLLSQKRFINEMFLFNKNTTVPGTKFIFTPDYKRIAREQTELLGLPKGALRETSLKEDLIKAYGKAGAPRARDIINQDLERQFRQQFPNVNPPNFKNMADQFKLKGTREDPFGLYKYMPDHYVPENIYEALTGEIQGWSILLDNVPFYKGFLGFKGLTQAGKTVFSPTTQIRNFTSAAFFALHNGHIGRPFGKVEHTFADIIRAHLDEVFPAGKVTKEQAQKVLGENRIRAIELGVTQSNVMGREIDDLLADVVAGGSKHSTTQGLFKKLTESKAFKKSQELYMKGDDIWKDYGWRFTQSQLKEALPTGPNFQRNVQKFYAEMFGKRFNFLNGDGSIKSSKEVIEEISAQYIKNTYPNYNYVPQFVKDLRRLPLGNFISFPAEILRTSANLMKFAAKEMSSSNPVIRKMGAKRMMGQSVGLTAGTALSIASMSALGMNKEQYESFRETQVPEWNKYGDLIMLSKQEKNDGNIVYRYIPFSYQNPYAYLQAPFYAFSGEMAAGKKVGVDFDDRFLKGVSTSIAATLQPFVDEAILTERLLDITTRKGQPRRGRRLWVDSPDTSIGDKMYASFGHLLEGVQPGVFTQGARITQAVAEEQTAYGKQYEIGDEALALFAGIRVYDADLANNLNFNYNDFARVERTLTAQAKGQFFAANATRGTRISAYQNYLDSSFEAYNRFEKLTNDLKKLGINDRYITKFLKQRGAKKNIQQSIKRNQFIPPNPRTFYDDERFKKLAKELGVSRSELYPREEIKEIYNNYKRRDLLQSISVLRSQIREENQPPAPAPQGIAQAQGPTVNVPPALPPAPVTQVAGLTPTATRTKSIRQRIAEEDEFLKDVV